MSSVGQHASTLGNSVFSRFKTLLVEDEPQSVIKEETKEEKK